MFVVVNKTDNCRDDRNYRSKRAALARLASFKTDYPEKDWILTQGDEESGVKERPPSRFISSTK